MTEKKEKQYVIDNARLMEEWNWAKNDELGLDPQGLTILSSGFECVFEKIQFSFLRNGEGCCYTRFSESV